MNRQLAIQKIRKQLHNRLPSIGSWMQIPHPSIAEVMGQAGYDWVAVEDGAWIHQPCPVA